MGVLLLATTGLAACGDDSAEDPDFDKALLVADDLGPDFRIAADDEEEKDDDDSDPDWGCLLDFKDDAADESEDGDDDDIEVELEAAVDPGAPGVFQVVVDVGNEDKARKLVGELADRVDGCHSVDTQDEDTRWQFDVDSDRVAWADGADQQVNVAAAGKASFSGVDLPVSLSFTLVRMKDVVSMVMFFDMASDIDEANRDVVGVVVDRLSAALDGDDQPEPAGVLEDYPIGEEFNELLGGADA